MDRPKPSLTDRALDIAAGSLEPGRYDREQRSFRRRPYHGWVALMPVSESGRTTEPFTVRGKDISAGGMGILSGRRVAPGTRGALMVLRSNGELQVLQVTIVYCNQRGDIDYECGMRFDGVSSTVGIDEFRVADGRLPDIGPASSAA